MWQFDDLVKMLGEPSYLGAEQRPISKQGRIVLDLDALPVHDPSSKTVATWACPQVGSARVGCVAENLFPESPQDWVLVRKCTSHSDLHS